MTQQQTHPNNTHPAEDKPTPEKTTPPLSLSHLSREELEAKLNETEIKLNEANSALEEHKNEVLRNQAELDNIRKRANKDIQNAHKYGVERFVNDFLPVMDSLEQGMNIQVGDNEFAKQIHAGLEMTLKMLLDTLEKSSIKTINPLGEVFDPALHQAISTQESKEAKANTVVQVLQKGYQLHDRLIRPALVVVAK